MREVKIGAPGFVLAKDMEKDMAGTLDRVAELGFDGIEITGFFGHSAEAIAGMCKKSGLLPFGCFVMVESLLGEPLPESKGNWADFAAAFGIPAITPDEAMAYLKTIGCQYIGLLPPRDRPTEEIFAKYREAAEYAGKYGMKLQYHNHDFEFTNMENGVYRMDHILESLPNEVLYEPDLGWMSIGGYPPEKALRKYAGRIEIVHLKDYWRAEDNYDFTAEYKFRPTGYGVMDWARLLPLSEELIKPTWYVTDHDSAYDGDIYQELGMSLNYVRDMLRYC